MWDWHGWIYHFLSLTKAMKNDGIRYAALVVLLWAAYLVHEWVYGIATESGSVRR
jgi:hypothetical protein